MLLAMSMKTQSCQSLFSEAIRRNRKRLGLTQQELADKTNLGLRSIQSMEYGETFAGLDTLNSLARALDIPIAKLFVSEEDEHRERTNNFRAAADFLMAASKFVESNK